MKRLILVLAMILLSGCVPGSPGAPTPSDADASPTHTAAATMQGGAGGRRHTTLAMGYIPSVQFAPFYVALDRGYFADEGLDVTLRYGMENDLLTLVGTNELQFMIGSGEEIILGRSQGLPVRYVMRWYRRFPVVLFAKADAGIRSPQDLVGRRVGLPGLYGANYVGWEAMIYASGLDEKLVSLQSIGYTQAAAIDQGQVDAALDYIVNGPVQLRLAGQDVTVISISDFVDLPSNGIITNETTINTQPELVQAMVRAALRGLEDTLEDPDSAFQASLQAVPEAGGEQTAVSRAIFDESLKLWQASRSELGRSDRAAWAAALAFMRTMGLIQSDLDVDMLFTNQFVERD